jgi:hypothetical protein
MDTFVMEYFLKRIFRVEKLTTDCRRHVSLGKFGTNELMIEPATGRWFGKCAKCKRRRVYSRMVRCFGTFERA